MKKNRLLSILLSILMAIACFPTGTSYAATNVRIYFDNYYTQFDEVYIQGRTVIGSDWKSYKMEDAGNGFLVATVTDKVELLHLSRTTGGYSEGNGETDYDSTTYGWDMPADGTLMVPTNNGSVSWVDYSTYERATVEKQYTNPTHSISEQPSFNESLSNVTELTIDGVDALAAKKGTGWEYKNNYLYLGENAPFDSSITAKGDLSVIVVGSVNTLSKGIVAGNLTLSVMGGVLNTKQEMTASNLTLNLSSYGVMSQKSGTIQATNITINTRQNGKLNLRTNSGSAIAMKCENATINGGNTNEVNMFFGGGSCCGIYATESLTVNNCVIGKRGSGGSNYSIYCDEPIIYNNASENNNAHLIHFAEPWSTLQNRSDEKHQNGIRVRRCLECGQIVDVEMDYYSHSFGVWKTIKDSTCTEKGNKERECSVCHLIESDEILAKGHKIVEDSAVPATETSTGLTAGKHCSICGKVFEEQKIIPKLTKTGQSENNQGVSKQKKKAQPMTVTTSKKTVKASKLKKKAQTVKPITVKSAQGAVSYKIAGGKKKSKKVLKINAKTGKITVKKKTKKGTYKVNVAVTATGNEEYNVGSKTVEVTVKVK